MENMQNKPENPAINANKNQFMSSFKMLKDLITICPDHVWSRYFYEVPFWYQVYHTVYFVDYWMREDYGSEFIPLMGFGPAIPPEFETEIKEDMFISRSDMEQYIKLLEIKLDCFFSKLEDEDLGRPIAPGADYHTYTDVFVCQNRHVMYNVGYLNGLFRSLELPESDWWAYNEKE